jgi:hypothetical protein
MNQKGQMAFDFILGIVIFFLIIGFLLAFLNDMNEKNELIKEDLQNHSIYLKINDYVQSTRFMEADVNISLESYTSDCTITRDTDLVIGSQDSNFIIQNYSGILEEGGCKRESFNVR